MSRMRRADLMLIANRLIAASAITNATICVRHRSAAAMMVVQQPPQQQQLRRINTSHVCEKNPKNLMQRHKRTDVQRLLNLMDQSANAKKKASPLHEVWLGITVHQLSVKLRLTVDELYEVMLHMPENLQVPDEVTPINDKRTFAEFSRLLKCRFTFIAKPHAGKKRVLVPDDPHATLMAELSPPLDKARLGRRPPVVVIMGHVDHGKTTLLDQLRRSQQKVVDSEFGGITQHVGAFTVNLDAFSPATASQAAVSDGEQRHDEQRCRQITFIDTPGHAAFSLMRSRGAKLTDIALLVVDACEGVLPQTVESIRMIREGGAHMIVVLNKIDKASASVEGTRHQLYEDYGVQLESFGGDVQSVAISALHGTNISDLVASIHAQAELLNLQAEFAPPHASSSCFYPMEGRVIEAQTQTGLGRVASVLVTRGRLSVSSYVVANTTYAKVRRLLTPDGSGDAAASGVGPSEAARVCGWKELPAAGDIVYAVPNEKRAKEVVKQNVEVIEAERMAAYEKRVESKRASDRAAYEIYRRKRIETGRRKLRYFTTDFHVRQPEYVDLVAEGKLRLLPHIIRTDVYGSLEAIRHCLASYGEAKDNDQLDAHETTANVVLDEVTAGIGAVTDADIERAATFGAKIYAFNVPVSQAVYAQAADAGVPVEQFNVIYHLIDDVKSRINDALPQVRSDVVHGRGKVQQIFTVSVRNKPHTVAGTRVTEGVIDAKAAIRIVRNAGETCVWDGEVAEMRHLKTVVTSQKAGGECGIMLAGIQPSKDGVVDDDDKALAVGDTVESYDERYVSSYTSWNPGF